MGTPYEIKIKSITIGENGFIEEIGRKETVKNGIVFILYYPTVGKPSLISTREVSLADNETLNFGNEPLSKQILFKENMLGEAYLEIEVTSIDKVSKIRKIFHRLIGTAAKAATGFIPGGAIVTGAAKTITESLFESIKPDKDKMEVIGKYGGTINDNHNSGITHLPLYLPKEIVLKKRDTDEHGRQIFYTKKIAKGTQNGHIELEMTQL